MMAWGWSPPPSSPASASVTESVAEAPVRNQSLHNLPQALSLVLQLLQLHLPYCRLLLLTVLQLSPPYAPAISQAMSPTFLGWISAQLWNTPVLGPHQDTQTALQASDLLFTGISTLELLNLLHHPSSAPLFFCRRAVDQTPPQYHLSSI